MSSQSAPSSRQSSAEHEILFQNWFKSVGPRTYAAQIKKARNGNHFLVLTEGRRDKETGELRKISLFVFSEDFTAFFKMLHETAVFIRQNPVPDEVKKKRERFQARRAGENANRGRDERPTGPARRPAESANPRANENRPAPPRRQDRRAAVGAA